MTVNKLYKGAEEVLDIIDSYIDVKEAVTHK